MDERIRIYAEITGFTPSLFQQDLIADRVQDVNRWRKAIIWWMGNGYRAQSVLKVIEYHETMDEPKYGKPKVDMYVGAHTEAQRIKVEPDPPCDICGAEICFSLHREERAAREAA